jgi:SAM-dependent methyltransferase
MPALADILAPYNAEPDKLARQYESRPFEDIHSDCQDLIPCAPGFVLDIGAGSGRDAAWFANQGLAVIAVEPAQKLRELAQCLHPDPHIRWIDDSLPDLTQISSFGPGFDLIWLSAVWMHLPLIERPRAFGKLVSLLAPGGGMMISIRQGPLLRDRMMFPTSLNEIEFLAQRYGLKVVREKTRADQLGREGVSWRTLVLQV